LDNLEPDIRNSVRAVIIRDGRILLLRKEYEDGSEQFALPGGGQETGEPLAMALIRECQEEIGADVQIGSLIYVADRFKPRDTPPGSIRHLVEFLFSCNVVESYTAQNGHHPDRHQVEVVWVELASLDSIPLRPYAIGPFLQHGQDEKTAVYSGLID
jgi:ADP-ribose pyrophosphatase YjhB (NUDIX family)